MVRPIRKVPSATKVKASPEWAKQRQDYDRERYLERKALKEQQVKSFLDQEGRGECWICRRQRELRPHLKPGSKQLAGLLCKPCHLGIQKFEEDPDLVEEAMLYLRRCGDVGDG